MFLDNKDNKCPRCNSGNVDKYSRYKTKENGERYLYQCSDCKHVYSETSNTLMFNIKKPLSMIATTLRSRVEGLGFNATCRIYSISSHTLQSWESKFAELKDILMAYTLSHSFLEMVIEGDELYTKVKKNVPQEKSEGWTIVLMDRASRFIFDMHCGEKDRDLFLESINILCH